MTVVPAPRLRRRSYCPRRSCGSARSLWTGRGCGAAVTGRWPPRAGYVRSTVSEPGGDDVAHAGEAFLRFNERELRQWPLAVRCTVELVGTFLLTLVAAGPGVINAYVGGAPIGQAAAVIAPG